MPVPSEPARGVTAIPVEPTTYHSGPVSPQQLNTDLYSYNGTGYGASGVLFLAHRPVMFETLLTSRSLTVSTGGTWSQIQGTGTQAFNVIDTAALFGVGAEYPGVHAVYHFVAQATSAGGSAGKFGGQYLAWNFAFAPGAAAAPASVGAGMQLQPAGSSSTFFTMGAMQRHYTSHGSCAPYVDLLSVGDPAQQWQPAAFLADGSRSSETLTANSTDTTGSTCRNGWVWTGVTLGGGTVGSVPAPQANWGTVTSAALNSSVSSALTFLYNPPLLRENQFLSTSVSNNSVTTVPFSGAPDVDTYSQFSTSGHTWTAPLNGLYLAVPTIVFAENGNGIRYCGVKVGPSSYQGPYYSPSSVNVTAAMSTRVLDLQAGDTVSVFCYQNSGGSLALASSYLSRWIMVYLGPYAPSNTTYTYTVPDTAFRWMAGQASGTALTALLNTHLGNDLNFLLNRPYFTGYQTSAQSGFANNSSFHQLTIDTVGGLVHGSNGDNYGGWSSSNHWYVAPVAGWYLVICEAFFSNPAAPSDNGYLTVAISVPTSGGQAPSSSPDWYQQSYYDSSGGPPGGCAIGVYYLAAGETVYPMIQAQDWGGTWGTTAASGTYSQLSVVWLCS